MTHTGPTVFFTVSIETEYLPFISPRLFERLTDVASEEGEGTVSNYRWWRIPEGDATNLMEVLDILSLARVPFIASFGQMGRAK